MTDDALRETMEALREGKRPPCPWCGASLVDVFEGWDRPRWDCGTTRFFYETNLTMEPVRSTQCYERQLAAKDAEIEHWRTKAKAYGNIVHGVTPALAKAGFPVDESGQDTTAAMAKSVEKMSSEIERLKNLCGECLRNGR